MLDRESTFALPETVALLQKSFVPVALDQAYQRRQQDTEGEFYRRIAQQGPRSDLSGTTQGFYVASSSGKLLLYNNNRDPQKVLRLLKKSLGEFQELEEAQRSSQPLEDASVDPRYQPKPPSGGLVVRVRGKVLGGYEPTEDRWEAIFQNALSRDNLWISEQEHQALVQDDVLPSLQQRIARFHLVDNTRGEPPMWRPDQIRHIEMSLSDSILVGRVHLESDDGERGFIAELRGRVEHTQGEVTSLRFVALGEFWGHGRYTKNPPPGKFPLAIGFTLADGSDVADEIPPQGSRGWVQGYIK